MSKRDYYEILGVSRDSSAAELKKDEYLKSVELLKKLIQEKGTKKDLTRITAIGYLIETTDFLNIPPDKKDMLKENILIYGYVINAIMSTVGVGGQKYCTYINPYQNYRMKRLVESAKDKL